MGTIADKLAYLGQTKAEIRDAIIKKGVAVPSKTTFREYAGKIREINAGDETENLPEWERPDDWLQIEDSVNKGDQKFVGLYAIFRDSNFIALSATGNYTVDWGDGKIENYESGATAYHVYEYESFPGTETKFGYRQAIVTVTPQSTFNLTSINLNEKFHAERVNNYNTGWMDIRVSGELINKFTISGPNFTHGYLESFSFVGGCSITDFSGFFARCYALQSVLLQDTSRGVVFTEMFNGCALLKTVSLFDTSKGRDFRSMFAYCYGLKTIPLFNTENGTNFSYMFQNCIALKRIPLLNTAQGRAFFGMFSSCLSITSVPLLDTGNGTDFGYMFGTCYILETIPQLNTSSGVNFYAMFGSCLLLKEIPVLDTSRGENFAGMFGSCATLKTVPPLKTSSGTNFSNMFGGCGSLKEVPQLDTSNGIDFTGMFFSCNMLDEVPALDTARGYSFGSMFAGCTSLSRSSIFETRETISYTGCKLSRGAIVDIFKNLGSGVAQKAIMIDNNWGTTLLTEGDREIATKKGWLIYG